MRFKHTATTVPHRPGMVRRVLGLDTLEGQAGMGHPDCWESSWNVAG